jgi:hypothetical protein
VPEERRHLVKRRIAVSVDLIAALNTSPRPVSPASPQARLVAVIEPVRRRPMDVDDAVGSAVETLLPERLQCMKRLTGLPFVFVGGSHSSEGGPGHHLWPAPDLFLTTGRTRRPSLSVAPARGPVRCWLDRVHGGRRSRPVDRHRRLH